MAVDETDAPPRKAAADPAVVPLYVVLSVNAMAPDMPPPDEEVASPDPPEALMPAMPGAFGPTKFGSAIKFEASPK